MLSLSKSSSDVRLGDLRCGGGESLCSSSVGQQADTASEQGREACNHAQEGIGVCDPIETHNTANQEESRQEDANNGDYPFDNLFFKVIYRPPRWWNIPSVFLRRSVAVEKTKL